MIAETALSILSHTGTIAFIILIGLRIDLWWLSRKIYKDEQLKLRREVDKLNLEIHLLNQKLKK